ncbi:hypothetical protein Q0812_02315 [Brevundimonas sp. 2R-24]|uniref:Uncharacterized protein n=1 Tax=Peiella sedimenti TaxID=3061083 RepID=A0ABT8SI66_9CAUL|nr:hypothetical protein [Caulobacteraceae bacterium XZ-24]
MKTKSKVTTWAAIAALIVLAPLPAAAQRRAQAPEPEEIRTRAEVALGKAQIATCTPTLTSRWGGQGSALDAEGVRRATTFYEMVCEAGPGYIIVEQGENATATPCPVLSLAARQAEAAGQQAGPTCQLPQNQDMVRAIQPLARVAAPDCTVDEAQLVGRTTDGQDRWEISCAGSDGYWIEAQAGAAQPGRVLTCLQVQSAGGPCPMTTQADQVAWARNLVAQTGRTCEIDEVRHVGFSDSDDRRYYEVGCGAAPGFMIRTNLQNAYQAVIDCSAAGGIMGGCTLTDMAVVEAAVTNEMSQRLSQAGGTCAYQDHRVIGRDSNQRTVVEFKCSDRELGVIAFLPEAGATRPGEVMDCIRGEGRSATLACTLTPRAALLARLTQLMTADNKPCDVREFRALGLSADDGDVVEVKCGAGGGFIAELSQDRRSIGRALTCEVSAQRGGDACEL